MQVKQDWTEADVPVQVAQVAQVAQAAQVAQVEGQLEHLVIPDWV